MEAISSLEFIQIAQSTLDIFYYTRLTAVHFEALAYCVIHYNLPGHTQAVAPQKIPTSPVPGGEGAEDGGQQT